MEDARRAEAAAEREARAASARRKMEEEAVSAARLRKIRAHRVSMLKASATLPSSTMSDALKIPARMTGNLSAKKLA